ncbi:pentapeptide repeat-containing protein [Nonomuraea basaltis]|uniref:pentapeptide repeat-containing protein n=1 Tax=Nonomuraea basaltis TaxID=2495887 RepID=UPI00110C6665|nr:pentapeptide repeat-containing protein [Nonomuraea basaltis]TMR93933.1 pentapeptide repeat-containing protein [Nonomuraea basaltis]
MRFHRLGDHESSARPRPLRVLPWWIALVGVIMVIMATWATTAWLLAEANQALPQVRAGLRIDAIRTGLSVGAGTGGAFALLLALRRQWLNERAQAHQEKVAAMSELDAVERRITELYTKAGDQLGNERAPVRLAGLYALERLGQTHPDHRQTVVDVICAYLRMPFASPAISQPPARPPAAEPSSEPGPKPGEHHPRQELQVRLTAQRILTDHLHDMREGRRTTPANPRFWAGMQIDLTGAMLVDFDFGGCHAMRAIFDEVRFVGGANFAYAEFDTDAYFEKARFEDKSGHFHGARFGRRAVFVDTDFGGEEASFASARFCGMTFFSGVRLEGGVRFDDAQALLDFDTRWGNERNWPPRWSLDSMKRQDEDWAMIVREDHQTVGGPL